MRFKQTTECCVRGCGRHPEKDSEFCRRCFTWATDAERAGYLFALHAPFWPTGRRYRKIPDETQPYGYRWEYETEDMGTFSFSAPEVPNESWVISVDNGFAGITFYRDGKRERSQHFSYILREFEHRTTREAIAEAVYRRKAEAAALNPP